MVFRVQFGFNILVKILRNIALAPLTTFNIGGNAKFFVEVGSADELKETVEFAKENKLPIFVLGGGSNILISDEGFDGLVIKINIRGLWITDTSSRLSTDVVVNAGAGEMWDDIVARAVELNASGIENLSLIPGTVGGAVYQNIGAYGTEIKDVLVSVTAYDISTDNIVRLSNKKCEFEYRSSVFKKNKKLIILEAELLLPKNKKPNLSYPDLQRRFEKQSPTLNEVRQAVIDIRLSKLPYPLNIIPQILKHDGHHPIANAGSFFKNPTVKISNYDRVPWPAKARPGDHSEKFLISKHPDLKGRNVGNGLIKLSAAQLIEKAGWKGKIAGNVGVSDKHALVLVNYGGGTAKELMGLAFAITEDVKRTFGVVLDAEVEII